MKIKLGKEEATRRADNTQLQVKNILKLYNECSQKHPDTINEGLSWYTRGKEIIIYWSQLYKLKQQTIAGIIAAISPGTNWIQNIVDANNLITGLNEGRAPESIIVTTYGNQFKNKAIKIYDGNNSLSEFDIYCILRGNSKEVNKTASFYMNLLHPENCDYVTIDRHAFRINLACLTIPNICLTEKRYKIMKQAYRLAGKKLGMRGCEIQAIVWLYFRKAYLDKIAGKPEVIQDEFVFSKVMYNCSRSVYVKQIESDNNVPF